MEQAAAAYLAVAAAANVRLKALAMESAPPYSAPPDLIAERATELNYKAILLDAKAKLAQIRWPAQVGAKYAAVVAALDMVVSLIDQDPDGTYSGIVWYELYGALADAANALRAQIGLPANHPAVFTGSLL